MQQQLPLPFKELKTIIGSASFLVSQMPKILCLQTDEEPSLIHPQSSWEPVPAELPEEILILFQTDSHTI